METKIIIDVVCIHCGNKVQLQKKKLQQQCKFVCPACKRPLHILFNTTIEPQTYSFFAISPQVHNVDSKKEEPNNQAENNQQQEAGKKKTIYKKDKNKPQSYDNIPGEYDDKPIHKNRPKFKDTIYLTRKKLLGFVVERYQLFEGRTIIGREDNEAPSDISLCGDDTISRRSISIDIVADDYGFDYIMKVLNASNPVRVNGKQIHIGEKVYLDFGDIITIGKTNLTFDNK